MGLPLTAFVIRVLAQGMEFNPPPPVNRVCSVIVDGRARAAYLDDSPLAIQILKRTEACKAIEAPGRGFSVNAEVMSSVSREDTHIASELLAIICDEIAQQETDVEAADDVAVRSKVGGVRRDP